MILVDKKAKTQNPLAHLYCTEKEMTITGAVKNEPREVLSTRRSCYTIARQRRRSETTLLVFPASGTSENTNYHIRDEVSKAFHEAAVQWETFVQSTLWPIFSRPGAPLKIYRVVFDVDEYTGEQMPKGQYNLFYMVAMENKRIDEFTKWWDANCPAAV